MSKVSGIKFAFDPSKRSGERIDPLLLKIQNQTLDLKKVSINYVILRNNIK